MVSHAEYVADQDEDQLSNLINEAQARRTKLRESGWVKTLVVSDDSCNLGWFSIDDYESAGKLLLAEAHARISRKVEFELCINKGSYRPEEAAQLIAETKKRTI